MAVLSRMIIEMNSPVGMAMALCTGYLISLPLIGKKITLHRLFASVQY